MQTNNFVDTHTAAKLEGLATADSIIKRIRRGRIREELIKRTPRDCGGYSYELHISALSVEAQQLYFTQTGKEAEVFESSDRVSGSESRSTRSDKGTTKTDTSILMRAGYYISLKRASYEKKLNRRYGFKEGYNYYLDMCKAEEAETVGYRRFIDLAAPFVDREVQKRNTLGPHKYDNKESMVLLHDYSIYEPMQMIQNDHTQFDVLCIYEGRIIRPWASFHFSAGDRKLSYPTIVNRPDSYSLADDLMNFVLRYGLSQKPVIYVSDNGKAQKARLMTRNETGLSFEDTTLNPFNIEEKHEQALQLMGFGLSHQKGINENLGMIESHSGVKVARAKIIERAFGVGGSMEWFVDRPEYTGRRYQEQPEKLSKLIKSGNIWHAEELVEYVINKVDQYNNRSHQGIKKERKGIYAIPHLMDLDVEYFRTNSNVISAFQGYKPDTMNDVARIFNDSEFAKRVLKTEIYSPNWLYQIYQLCGWESRALPSRETLSMMAMGYEIRTVHHWGINIKNEAYVNYSLKDYIGKKVVCRFSPDNIVRIKDQAGKEKIYIKEIYVFDEKTENFICIAEPHPNTVRGLKPEGYAKTFISIRNEHNKEVITARKIMKETLQGKIEESVRTDTPVFKLSTARDLAAQKMEAAKVKKLEKVQNKEKEKSKLEDDLSAIYGTKINVEG